MSKEKSGFVGFHTNSSIRAWRKCRRLYRYRYVDRIRIALPSKALLIGLAVHYGLELFLKGNQLEAILHAVAQSMKEPYWLSDKGRIEAARVMAILTAYYKHWDQTRGDWQLIETEKEFRYLCHIIELAGKIDAIARHRSADRLHVWEHKTTSDDIADIGCAYWDRLALDNQLTMYHDACSVMYGDVSLLYDVIKKPTGKPRSKARVVKRKNETEEDVEKRKAESLETIEEFQDRLVSNMLANPDIYFVRRKLFRTAEQIQQLRSEVEETAEEIEQYNGSYPRNDGACSSGWGNCEYLGVCAGTEMLDSEKFIKVDKAHTELNLEEREDKDNG